MLQFFSKKQTFIYRLVVSIEEDAITAAIARFGDTVEVFQQEKVVLTLAERKGEKLMLALMRALEEVLKRMTATTETVTSTEVIIGSPFVTPRFVHTRDVLDHPMTITREGIRSFAKAVLQEPPEKGFTPIARRVTRMLLNGYPTDHPEGQKASVVELDVVECDVEDRLIERIENTLKQSTAHGKITFHATLFPLARLINALDRDACLIDIGPWSSELLVVHHAMLQQAQPLPWGYGKILSLLNAHSPESSSTLLEAVGGELDTSALTMLQGIKNHESALVSEFGEFFAAVSTPHKMPNKLWISAPKPLEAWALEFFARIDFSQFTRTSRPMTTTLVPLESLTNLPTITGSLDPRLLLAIRAVYNNYQVDSRGIQSTRL